MPLYDSLVQDIAQNSHQRGLQRTYYKSTVVIYRSHRLLSDLYEQDATSIEGQITQWYQFTSRSEWIL